MSTARQVADLVRPFLERNPDFELVGRSLVLKPVRHVLRRFFIDRTSIKNYIQPSWSASAMFGPPSTYGGGIGARLIQGGGYVDRPETQSRLLDELEQVTSSVLRKSDRLDEWPMLARRVEPLFGPGSMTFGIMHMARGEFAEAIPYVRRMLMNIDASVETCSNVVARHLSPESRLARFYGRNLVRALELQTGYRALYDLLASGDRPAIAERLHRWEAAAANDRKIEHLWEPSPFPFEVGTTTEVRPQE